MRVHPDDEPWFCPRCQREFVSDAKMMEHIKSNHPDLLAQIIADEEPVRP